MLAYIVLIYFLWGPPQAWQHQVRPALPAWTVTLADRALSDAQPAERQTTPCGSAQPGRGGMQQAHTPQLRKLAEYEAVCEARFSDVQMLFSPLPTTVEEGARLGRSMAKTLQEFDTFSVLPLVVLEPLSPVGEVLPIADIGTGSYDAALRSYYQSLKDAGIDDGQMGTWVPLPEANTPVWDTTNPQLFVSAVNKLVSLQKQRFPTSKASVLLASQSYPEGDTTWQKGGYRSLLPYVRGLKNGLIDTFGYQGFPWMPQATQKGTALLDPAAFLRTDVASTAADALGVRDIWFNSGTFGRAHADVADDMVMLTAKQRSDILQGMVRQAQKLQAKDYRVAIHLFAEDKSGRTEAIDWSYWRYGHPGDSDAMPVFRGFVRAATAADVAVWVYDDDHLGVR